MASEPHSLAQCLQPRQSSGSTLGFPSWCCSILPALEPEPIPIFLIAPPKPVDSCPLKWVNEINTSASIMALPILADLIYSPSIGTSVSSVPLKPSPMITWQPVEMVLKPLSSAQSRWSSAFLRLPGYKVLQSVRKGLPPFSLTISAIAFA